MSDPTPTPSNIYPSLSYDDAPAAIEWLCRTFGFTKRLVVSGPGGTVEHSELILGPGAYWSGDPRMPKSRVKHEQK